MLTTQAFNTYDLSCSHLPRLTRSIHIVIRLRAFVMHGLDRVNSHSHRCPNGDRCRQNQSATNVSYAQRTLRTRSDAHRSAWLTTS